MELSFTPLGGWAVWLTKQQKWVQFSSQQDMFSINTLLLFSSRRSCTLNHLEKKKNTADGGTEEQRRDSDWSKLWAKHQWCPQIIRCPAHFWANAAQLSTACLQGLRLAFIPLSAARACTPPGHEGRGMHSNPPPSSPLSLQRSRDGGPFMESNQDPQASDLSVFHPSLYLLTFCSFFSLSFVRGVFAVVEYTLQLSRSLAEGRAMLGWGPW